MISVRSNESQPGLVQPRWIVWSTTSHLLTSRRHIDLLRVSSAACLP
ncbi:putative leader peptide [Frankia sp. Cj3]